MNRWDSGDTPWETGIVPGNIWSPLWDEIMSYQMNKSVKTHPNLLLKPLLHILMQTNEKCYQPWPRSRGVPIRYSGSVSLRYWHFLILSDETDPNSIFCIANIVLLLSPTHIIKHHTVFVRYISSVMKPLRNLMWGTDEYLSKVHVNTSLCHPPFSFQTVSHPLESRR